MEGVTSIMQQFHSSQEEQTTLSPPPEQMTKSQEELKIARQMKKDWEGFRYAACFKRLKSLDAVENAEALALIYAVLQSSQGILLGLVHHHAHRRTIAERAAYCLCSSPSEEALPYLVQMLFIKDSNCAQMADYALAKHGNAMLPSLIEEMEAHFRRPYWNAEGVHRILALIKRFGDSRVCNVLLRIAEKRINVDDGRGFKYAPLIGFIFVSLFMIPLGFLGSTSLFVQRRFTPEQFTVAVLGYLASYLVGVVVFSILCVICLLPFQLLYAQRQQHALADRALLALQVFHDKSVAPALVRLAWSSLGATNYEALKALRPLLPLVTSQDTTLFSSDEERLLVNALEKHDEELTLSILHVLECVGTEASLQRLNRLVKSGHSGMIVENATRVYTAITERVNRKEAKKSLLRASEIPEHNNELLRPAQDDPEQEAQKRELLRPTEGEP